MRTDDGHSVASLGEVPLREEITPCKSRPASEHRQRRRPVGTSKNTMPNVEPTNFLSVSYRMPISGIYVVDPGLEMPTDLVTSNLAKKNLSLECTRGSITADVWLVDGELPMQRFQRAVIDVLCKSWMGKVDVKLYSPSVRPFSLTVMSNAGDISVALPSDFVGPITLSTGSLYDSFRLSSFTPFASTSAGLRISNSNGPKSSSAAVTQYSTSITFSTAVRSRLVTFSEAGGKRTCFVGDYRNAGYTSRRDWTGSMVDIQSAYGNLRVSFVDESQEQDEASGCIVV